MELYINNVYLYYIFASIKVVINIATNKIIISQIKTLYNYCKIKI